MGNVSVLTNVTLSQLLEEAPVRWPALWLAEEPRMTCLVIIPRKSRPDIEHHGFFVEHLHPVFGLFYRPRDEASTIEQSGFDPLSASFQFLNIAVSDLGLWMQKFTEEQDFEQTSVKIEPLPSSALSSLRLGFETFDITTYRHQSLSDMARLPLVMPPLSLVAKAFLSIPDSPPPSDTTTSQIPGQLESPAEDIADVETAEPAAEVVEQVEAPAIEPTPPTEVETTEFAAPAPPAEEAPPAEAVTPDTAEFTNPKPSVEEIPTEGISDIPADEPVTHVIVDEGAIPMSKPSPASPPASTATHEIVAEQSNLPSEGVEAEFRIIVQRLMAEGLEHSAIMEDHEFQMISDRAQAAGINTWQLFLRIAT